MGFDRNRQYAFSSPKLPIDICLCERSEAISVYFDEIATHPMGALDDSDSVFLMAILGSAIRILF